MRNGIDLLTVLLIAALLLYYVELVGTAFVEMVFMLVILRRTALVRSEYPEVLPAIPGLLGQRQAV